MSIQVISGPEAPKSMTPSVPVVGKGGMLAGNQLMSIDSLTVNSTNLVVFALIGAIVAFVLTPENANQTRKLLMLLAGIALGASAGTMLKTKFTIGGA